MAIVSKIMFLILSYLLGACPNGYIIAKVVKNVDIRQCGSGNVGATNVFRVVGKRWGLLALLCDIAKGVLAVCLWKYVTTIVDGPELSQRFLFLCGVVAIMGHNWTIFLNFKGGKGVSTTLGVLLGLFPVTVLIATAVALSLIWITHYVSVGSIIGALIFPIIFAIKNRSMDDFPFFMVVILIIAVMIIVKHRGNIKRLLKGEENKAF
ncbi:glycerol-3-phosphate 1-O-acyltransferase PlsY [Candidatus Omnitrophota bacterium]